MTWMRVGPLAMEFKVRFAAIEGSREWTEPSRRKSSPSSVIHVENVQEEAQRRLKAIKLKEWRTREFITGQPMPDHVRHLAVQIEFAAQALSRLSPIPENFDDDIYWPRVWLD